MSFFSSVIFRMNERMYVTCITLRSSFSSLWRKPKAKVWGSRSFCVNSILLMDLNCHIFLLLSRKNFSGESFLLFYVDLSELRNSRLLVIFTNSLSPIFYLHDKSFLSVEKFWRKTWKISTFYLLNLWGLAKFFVLQVSNIVSIVVCSSGRYRSF